MDQRDALYDAKQQAASADACMGNGQIPRPVRPSLLDELRLDRARAEDRSGHVSRAIVILEHHPEFEDLIWLLRSGLV